MGKEAETVCNRNTVYGVSHSETLGEEEEAPEAGLRTMERVQASHSMLAAAQLADASHITLQASATFIRTIAPPNSANMGYRPGADVHCLG